MPAVMKVVALDPGETTGIAVYEQAGQPGYETRHWSQEQLVGHKNVYEFLCRAQPSIVVAESFVQSTGAGATNFGAVEIIGVIKLYSQLMSKPVVWQSRGIKKFWDDDKVKAVGLWEKGIKHSMDATRHLLYWQMTVQRDLFYVQRLRRAGIQV